MSRELVALAVVLSAFAVFLSTRSQTFTYVAVDGRTIRMLVAGSGDNTVVFENGYGAPLESWAKVQPEVSRFATTVTYDRAGFGLSEDGPLPRDGRHIATELHRALRLADVPPPYVIVGHSLGGLYVRVFAGLYPDEVAGMALVDPTQDAAWFQGSDLPELSSLFDTLNQARASSIPTGIPVVLINAMGPPEVPFATRPMRETRAKQRRELPAESRRYEQWLKGIPGGRLIVTEYSGHNVPHEQPELVVETVRRVVEQLPR